MTPVQLNLAKTRQTIEHHLYQHFLLVTPRHPVREVYEYALFPPGKLFRPLLVHALHRDFMHASRPNPLDFVNSNHSFLASFVEFHHAYTLAHDDLPCMDNDDMRRNKPTTHKKFGEWRALLVGDGLLNASYHLLSHLHYQQLSPLLRFISWCVGPKGLIQGQVLDLSHEMTHSFSLCKQTHQYKTARLLQVALVSSYALIPFDELDENQQMKLYSPYRTCLDLFKLGHHLGMVFQFLDDLVELGQKDLPLHERQVNPFFQFADDSFAQVKKSGTQVWDILNKYQLSHLRFVLRDYLKEVSTQLQKTLDPTIPGLIPIMAFLDRICQEH